MKLHAEIDGKTYDVGLPGIDLSIPLHFNHDQPNTYGVALARSEAYRSGGWVGDVREGGSCNFQTLTMTPHCNGTHTECIGHITTDRFAIREQLKDELVPAVLISVEPVKAEETGDTYFPALAKEDRVIDRASLERSMPLLPKEFYSAVVIRTLPNPDSKLTQDYMDQPPAFFTLDAMQYLVDLGMKHLLTDLPSVDRLFDEGMLRSHRVFWNIPTGEKDAGPQSRIFSTITELIFVPDHVEDGAYLLNLQVAPFMADAAPSRPVLFPLTITSR